MTSLLVGVLGHVDHGKTALVRALTGMETDRLPEEKARGLSIVPGYALLRLGEVELDLVDMPGHERFVRAMIAGATGIRAALVVIAADEGVAAQTREHLDIARLLGVRAGVTVLTKADRAEPDLLHRRAEEAARAVAEAGIEAGAPVPVCAPAGHGLDAVRQALGVLAGRVAPMRDDGFAHLPIDRVFAVPGIGPVVTGTLRRGCLRIGDAVEVEGRAARVRSLQSHGRNVREALPGRRTAVGLRGLDLADLAPGQVLGTPGALAVCEWVDVWLEASRDIEAPLCSGAAVSCLVGTGSVPARLRLLDRESLGAGDGAVAQLRLSGPLRLPAREPFVLRRGSPARTVGGGRVLDPEARRRRRHVPSVLGRLAILARGDPAEILDHALRESGPAGADVAALARLVAIAPERVRRRLAEIGARLEGGTRLIHPEIAAMLEARLRALLAAHHAAVPLSHGLPLPALAAELPSELPAPILADLVAQGVARGVLTREGDLVRLAGHDPAAHESPAARAVAEAFRRGGLRPPDPAEVVRTDAARAAFEHLHRNGELVRTRDRVQNRVLVFHRDAVAEAAERLGAAFGAERPFSAGEAGAVLGTSRKFSIPLLEYLDAQHVTRRRGEHRVMRTGPEDPTRE